MAKNADWILANDVRPETAVMGGADNQVTLCTATEQEAWPRMPKQEVATRLASRVAAFLKDAP